MVFILVSKDIEFCIILRHDAAVSAVGNRRIFPDHCFKQIDATTQRSGQSKLLSSESKPLECCGGTGGTRVLGGHSAIAPLRCRYGRITIAFRGPNDTHEERKYTNGRISPGDDAPPTIPAFNSTHPS